MRYLTVIALMTVGAFWLTRADHLVDGMRRRGGIKANGHRAQQIAKARAVGVFCLLLGVITFILIASGTSSK